MDNKTFQDQLSKQLIESSKNFKCEKCENLFFNAVFMLKNISALASPNGREINFPVQTFACTKCGHVNEEFIPKN